MEIDLREVPEGGRLDRVLEAAPKLGRQEVLTLLLADDPRPLLDSVRNVTGRSFDAQSIRWGLKDLPWVAHLKHRLKA